MQLDITFEFFSDLDIDNRLQNTIHEILSEMFQEAGFGNRIHGENANLENEFAHPYAIGFVGDGRDEIFIGYMLHVDNNIQHGDLAKLLSEGVPNMITDVSNRFQNLHVVVRTSYLFD